MASNSDSTKAKGVTLVPTAAKEPSQSTAPPTVTSSPKKKLKQVPFPDDEDPVAFQLIGARK